MRKRDRVIRFLTALNKKELESRSRKFRKFECDGENYFFVGKAAAIRFGKNVSKSISITEKFHRKMELWEKENGLSW